MSPFTIMYKTQFPLIPNLFDTNVLIYSNAFGYSTVIPEEYWEALNKRKILAGNGQKFKFRL